MNDLKVKESRGGVCIEFYALFKDSGDESELTLPDSTSVCGGFLSHILGQLAHNVTRVKNVRRAYRCLLHDFVSLIFRLWGISVRK